MGRINDPNHERLERLLADYGAKLRALVATHGLARHGIDADDVEQEVRIRLWRAIERDRSAAFHASYIQRVVASTVIDALRRAQVRATEPLPEESEDGFQPFPDRNLGPEERASGHQHVEKLRSCLNALPERRRLPISLHLQGFALQEIADIVGTSAEAARKLVSRGMDELKDRLREVGAGDFDD
ncbi:RNA polymerase sigma factor [Tahibacter sp.]|uniref:RNA polymerase sigma factor n=1 Tax=Tahibacter sp. TaxID=2056211 RepID=UPI0028C48047|nr:RNA polymerase sigma factor [Tahibacter sp.]